MSDTSTLRCRTCGRSLTGTDTEGICVSCLWDSFVDDEVDAPAAKSSQPLFTIPGHEILREIARGGMGIVYHARQLEPPREVAVKMLLPFQATAAGMRERFRIEARAIAALDHSGILPIYQVGEHDGTPYFTLKLASGGSLAARRREFGGQWRRIGELMAAVADAVQFAHERGVLHRDLKPGNILFDETGRAYVSDFGLAKELSTDTDLTRSTDFLGTPHYVAPEVAAHSARAATISSDVYSLGAILYELLAGRPPFEAEGMPALLKKIAEEEAVAPSRFERGLQPASSAKLPAGSDSTIASRSELKRPEGRAPIPRDLEIICLKCLAKEPARRYMSAREFADDLRRWLSGEPILARETGALEKLWLWSRRHRATAVLLATVFVLLLALVVGLTVSAVRISASRTEAVRTVELLESQKAADLLRKGASSEGIALLARRVRADPANWRDTQRLMWALQLRRWALPVEEPSRVGVVAATDSAFIHLVNDAADGLLALVVGTNVVVHDVAAGTNRHVWPLPFVPEATAISEGGQWLGLGEREIHRNGGHRARFLDFETGRLLAVAVDVVGNNRALPVVFDHRGTHCFFVAPDLSGRVLGLQSGDERVLVPAETNLATRLLTHHPKAIFLPDQRRVAITDRDRTVRIFDIATGGLTGPVCVAAERLSGLGVSDDGRVLITQGAGLPQFWSLETGQALPEIADVSLGFKSNPFLPQSHAAIVAGNESGLVIYDADRQQVTNKPPRKRLADGGAFVTKNGQRASVALRQSHVAYELPSARPLCEPVWHRAAQGSFARFGGQNFVTLGRDASLVIWQARTNQRQSVVLAHGAPVHAARFSPDGTRVVTAALDGRTRLWAADTGKPLGPVTVHDARVWSACFSPDGKRVATASWDATARLWDADTGQPLGEPLRAKSYVFHVEFSPDGRQLLACGEDGRVRVYDGQSGVFRFELIHAKPVYWAHFSPDGEMIATRPTWDRPRLWQARSGALIRELEEVSASEATGAVFIRGDFSRDGRWLTLGSQARCATLWRMPGGERHATLAHGAVVRNAMFSPDAARLLVTADDLTSRLWDVNSGRPASGAFASPQSLDMEANSGNTLRAAAIHRDGRRAVTGGSDATLTFWDTENGFSLCEGLEAGGSIMQAEFSPDGTRVIAASLDGTARIWQLPPVLDRAPDWLAPLAEALVGLESGEGGTAAESSPTKLWRVCESIRQAPKDDVAAQWARELFGF